MWYKVALPQTAFPSKRVSPRKSDDRQRHYSLMYDAVSAILYPTVLIAEDSFDTRIMLKRALELKGYRVLEAEDGEQALEMAQQHQPSLMIIDLNMPVLDGLETIKKFRKLEGDGEHTPIVAITAYDVYGMEEAAIENGCNKYLSKPLDLEELDRALKSLGFVV
jgi:CheY-like chemotaxis protein